MFEHLLSPARIGSMELRNRIVMAPMGVEMVDDDGHANEAIIDYYGERARGGAGLIITEVGAIAYPRGANSTHQLGFSEDRFIPDLRRLTDRIHENGGRIAAQLVHHGKMSRVDARNGDEVLVPSLPEWHGSYDMAADLTAEELGMMMAAVGGELRPNLKPMTTDDIAEVTDQFAEAARRARDAGFDGVEIHGAHGYLLSGFLSPQWNLRDDEYGGSVEHRSRFLCEVLRASREATGDEIPIWPRLDAREYRTPDGIRFADTTVTARLAQEAGAAAVHLSAYGDSTSASAFTEGSLPHVEAKHAAESAALKTVVDIPVIGVGRLRPETGEQMIADGKADLIAMGRQMLADPETAAKLVDGRPEDIRPCINCYVCVASPFFDRRVNCAVNPALGNETELADATRTTTDQPKDVVVVGGGPAGMEAARVAASRGHRVTLLEASAHLGGALRFAALVYEPNQRLLTWFTRQMTALGVDVRTDSPATPSDIAGLHPDAVLIAVGGVRNPSQVPGAELDHVVDGDDLRKVLTGSGEGDASKIPLIGRLAATAGRLLGLTGDPARLATLTRYYMPVGKQVVVIGGGLVGIEIAEFLVDRKRSVTVLHEGPTMAPEMAHPRRWRVLADLRDHGTTLTTGATATRITETEVHYRLEDGTEASIDAASVIIATGLTGNPHLEQWSDLDGIEPVMIGDATGITYLEGAIHDGHRAALDLG